MLRTGIHPHNKAPSPFSHPKLPFVSSIAQIHGPFVRPFGLSTCSIDQYGAVKTHAKMRQTRNGVRACANDSEASAIINVKQSGFYINIPRSMWDCFHNTLVFELVSAQLDPQTEKERETIKGYANRLKQKNGMVKYEAKFKIPPNFGEIGAMLVQNNYPYEIYLVDIVFHRLALAPLRFTCNSWLHPKDQRIFFTNKSYLPSQTPSGLKKLRERELENLRGNGDGERKYFERIYDYDTYNDLGNPDKDPELARPVLGGKARPYPRRCRTGRSPCDTDPCSEKRASRRVYVPRDEQFSEVRSKEFSRETTRAMLHSLMPLIEDKLDDSNGFPSFTAIDSFFNNRILRPGSDSIVDRILPKQLVKLKDYLVDFAFSFQPPALFQRDRFSWLNDKEFARQTLAGVNPLSIKLVKEWPLRSELDPKIYGPPESAITTELVEHEMRGSMNIKEAMKQKRLFILDYHDAFSPYVNKVRELKGTTLYGSRTVFFLTDDGTLRPLAIELTRPPSEWKPQWKQAFTRSLDAEDTWLWRLAKAHVLAHDSTYHQVINHWLRTHCCTEPYIIATNRQLSTMHPIYKLLRPHFRYTMEINAQARASLINAGGIIESTFSLGKYSMDVSSRIYDKEWRFDYQALPLDLISRGMAVEDPSMPHGLMLTIKDYPFANDGVVLWGAIKQWVEDYVNFYYPEPILVESDLELQAWWEEIRTLGHKDKKDEPWWPTLKTPLDLVQVLTTIVWVASGLHAAVNFGQYDYAGYFPNRPTIARTKMPTEDPTDEEIKLFSEKPESVLLGCFPSRIQAAVTMSILLVLSTYSADEEYLGRKLEPAWEEEPAIKEAFRELRGRLEKLRLKIETDNNDKTLKNRNGVGIVPYELLKPVPRNGTKGVPNSISI